MADDSKNGGRRRPLNYAAPPSHSPPPPEPQSAWEPNPLDVAIVPATEGLSGYGYRNSSADQKVPPKPSLSEEISEVTGDIGRVFDL